MISGDGPDASERAEIRRAPQAKSCRHKVLRVEGVRGSPALPTGQAVAVQAGIGVSRGEAQPGVRPGGEEHVGVDPCVEMIKGARLPGSELTVNLSVQDVLVL